MERKSPNLDVLVTKDIKLEDINQAFTDLSSTGNQDKGTGKKEGRKGKPY